jgi:hypothetical protein
LYGSFWSKIFFSAVNFFHFLVIKTLDPDWIRIRIGIQPKMLDPDPYQMNTDPKHWFKYAKPKELEKRELIKVSVGD